MATKRKKKDFIAIPPKVEGYFTWNDSSLELEFNQTSRGGKVPHPLLNAADETQDFLHHSSFDPNQMLPPNCQKSKLLPFNWPRHYETLGFISLEDVKAVAIDLLVAKKLKEGNQKVSKEFEVCAMNEVFVSLLVCMLRYFERFFEKHDCEEQVKKSNFICPSKAEVQRLERATISMLEARNIVAAQYCKLLLGNGLENVHHMRCGERRISNSHRDLNLFEEIYSFITFFIWVAFGRRKYKLVSKEVGHLLRGDPFNPVNQPAMQKDGQHNNQKLNNNKSDKKTEKRPPIATIVKLRSTFITSILPTSKEKEKHLHEKTSGIKLHKLSPKEYENIFNNKTFYLKPGDKVGIIGDSYDHYNIADLTMIEDDNSDSSILSKDSSDIIIDQPSRVMSPNGTRQLLHRGAFSRPTTAASKTTHDETNKESYAYEYTACEDSCTIEK